MVFFPVPGNIIGVDAPVRFEDQAGGKYYKADFRQEFHEPL
jgi:hypothetical protein